MLIKIDASADRFALHSLDDSHGEVRRYYVADAPALMIVVTRGNTPLADLRGRVIDGSVGWHDGQYGFVRPGNENKRHSKLTVYGVVAKGLPSYTLTKLIADAPIEGDERPALGKA